MHTKFSAQVSVLLALLCASSQALPLLDRVADNLVARSDIPTSESGLSGSVQNEKRSQSNDDVIPLYGLFKRELEPGNGERAINARDKRALIGVDSPNSYSRPTLPNSQHASSKRDESQSDKLIPNIAPRNDVTDPIQTRNPTAETPSTAGDLTTSVTPRSTSEDSADITPRLQPVRRVIRGDRQPVGGQPQSQPVSPAKRNVAEGSEEPGLATLLRGLSSLHQLYTPNTPPTLPGLRLPDVPALAPVSHQHWGDIRESSTSSAHPAPIPIPVPSGGDAEGQSNGNGPLGDAVESFIQRVKEQELQSAIKNALRTLFTNPFRHVMRLMRIRVVKLTPLRYTGPYSPEEYDNQLKREFERLRNAPWSADPTSSPTIGSENPKVPSGLSRLVNEAERAGLSDALGAPGPGGVLHMASPSLTNGHAIPIHFRLSPLVCTPLAHECSCMASDLASRLVMNYPNGIPASTNSVTETVGMEMNGIEYRATLDLKLDDKIDGKGLKDLAGLLFSIKKELVKAVDGKGFGTVRAIGVWENVGVEAKWTYYQVENGVARRCGS